MVCALVASSLASRELMAVQLAMYFLLVGAVQRQNRDTEITSLVAAMPLSLSVCLSYLHTILWLSCGFVRVSVSVFVLTKSADAHLLFDGSSSFPMDLITLDVKSTTFT